MTRMAMPIPPPPTASPPAPPTRRPRTSLTWPGSSRAPLRNRTKRVLPDAFRRQTLERRQEQPERLRARYRQVRCGGELRGSLDRLDRDADGVVEAGGRQALECVQVGRVVPGVEPA